MKSRESNQKNVHAFLVKRFAGGEPFAKRELRDVTRMSKAGFDTFFSKHVRALVHASPDDAERMGVRESFQKYLRWEDFRAYVSQKRAAAEYACRSYANVIVFDFFMPLANEAFLRVALDSLFYRDAVERRLKSLAKSSRIRFFPRKAGEGEGRHIGRICDWISERFIGYSVSHVAGRYRREGLKRASEIYRHSSPAAAGYVADETTAIVRFIFPIGEHVEHASLPSEKRIEEFLGAGKAVGDESLANRIRWVFYSLFVQSIVELADSEGEIWLLESGFANRLHKWIKKA